MFAAAVRINAVGKGDIGAVVASDDRLRLIRKEFGRWGTFDRKKLISPFPLFPVRFMTNAIKAVGWVDRCSASFDRPTIQGILRRKRRVFDGENRYCTFVQVLVKRFVEGVQQSSGYTLDASRLNATGRPKGSGKRSLENGRLRRLPLTASAGAFKIGLKLLAVFWRGSGPMARIPQATLIVGLRCATANL